MTHDDKVHSVAFSPDGHLLASGSGDRTVKIWDASTGTCIRTFEGHSGSVYAIAFSPDGRLLASGGDDNSLRLWDLSSGQCVNMFGISVSYAIAFSPDGSVIAGGEADGVVRFWYARTGTMQGEIRSDRPYEKMDITDIKGLTTGQKDMLKALGAIEQQLQED
jgi:WD40 repeat protein